MRSICFATEPLKLQRSSSAADASFDGGRSQMNHREICDESAEANVRHALFCGARLTVAQRPEADTGEALIATRRAGKHFSTPLQR